MIKALKVLQNTVKNSSYMTRQITDFQKRNTNVTNKIGLGKARRMFSETL